jgi:hypothetical protein
MLSIILSTVRATGEIVKRVFYAAGVPTLLFGAFLGMCGCRNPQIVWSAESKSPDGVKIVTAQAYANRGFGISGVPATFVYLNWTTGSQEAKEIMDFGNEGDGADAEAVQIRWLSSNQLEVAYHGDRQKIGFQAVRYLGVDISIRDLSSSVPHAR